MSPVAPSLLGHHTEGMEPTDQQGMGQRLGFAQDGPGARLLTWEQSEWPGLAAKWRGPWAEVSTAGQDTSRGRLSHQSSPAAGP